MKQVAFQNVTKANLPHNGQWIDGATPGNGKFEIDDDFEVKWQKNGKHSCTGKELKKWMKENYGVGTVTYNNNEPDFMPFADKKIGAIYVDSLGADRGSGSYAQAYAAVAKAWGLDITKGKSEIEKYMKEHELTWHECADTHTIIAVPTRINSAFGHTGGIGVVKSIRAIAATIYEKFPNNPDGSPKRLVLSSSGLHDRTIKVDGKQLKKCISNIKKQFKITKRRLFH